MMCERYKSLTLFELENLSPINRICHSVFSKWKMMVQRLNFYVSMLLMPVHLRRCENFSRNWRKGLSTFIFTLKLL